MRGWTRWASAVAVAGLLGAAASADPIDARMKTIAADAPGCAVAVVEKGKPARIRSYGLADVEARRAIGSDTAFNIASMSKQFTGAAVALLVEDGALSLDDDVRRHLPELRDYGTPIRVRDLVHHTSGLRNHMALASFQPGRTLPTHEEALALVFRQSAVNFRPGTRHQYESPNYVLLAEIVARVSKMPFDRFLEERIFAPLGMEDTGFASPTLSRAYQVGADGKPVLNEAVNRARGSSGLLSTAEDFARWMTRIEAGVGKPGLLDRMTQGTTLADGSRVSYGYGLAVERDHARVPGLTMIAHGGQTAAYRSTFSYFPGHGFGVAMLCNRSDAPLDAASGLVEAWVKTHFKPVPAAAPAVSQLLTEEEAARFAGTYLDPVGDDLRSFVAEDGALKLAAFGQAFPLVHQGDGRFAFEGYGTFQFAGADSDVTMTETASDQARIAFRRLDPPQPRPFADYAGRYWSDDVDGVLDLGVQGDGLLLSVADAKVPLAAIHTDGFAGPEAGFGRIAFTRDTAGAVDGLTLSTLSGISRMRFRRL